MKRLIEELKNCKYEIKTLGDVISKFERGNKEITNSKKIDGNFPCVTCTDVFKNSVFINSHKIFIDEISINEKKVYLEFGDLLIATSGYTEKNNQGVCLYAGKNALAGNDTVVLKHNQNHKYLVHSLLINSSNKQIKTFLKTRGIVSIKKIDLTDIKKIKIPLPSLELQEKIGNFLFKFAEHEKKLQQELEHRRKQFHYYKELLFTQGLEKLDWEIRLRN